jgi:methylated-DNA-[protein]-cysteine S-methyltransferase
MMPAGFIYTPLGTLQLLASDRGLTHILFPHQFVETVDLSSDIIKLASLQLQEYFQKEREQFDLPLDAAGTDLQKEIWIAISQIPYGKVVSYKELAIIVGRPYSVRMVANANAKNPLPIIIPCHRVLGADGSMTGYIGGIENKERLLKIEKVFLQGSLF